MIDVKPLRRLTGGFRQVAAEALRERLIFLAQDFASSDGKFKYLEGRTGISAQTWEDLFLGKITPHVEMILALVEHRRDKIEWLLTGHVAEMASQKMPDDREWSKFQEQHVAKRIAVQNPQSCKP